MSEALVYWMSCEQSQRHEIEKCLRGESKAGCGEALQQVGRTSMRSQKDLSASTVVVAN